MAVSMATGDAARGRSGEAKSGGGIAARSITGGIAGEQGEEAGQTTRPALEASLASEVSAAGSSDTSKGAVEEESGLKAAWCPWPPAAGE